MKRNKSLNYSFYRNKMAGDTADSKEEKRLQALISYNILDTSEEADYDDLVKLASVICDTPVALISMIDRDRQWFKSHIGTEIRETPLELSFCTYTIASFNDIMIVEDATTDERFMDNPLVTGDPNIVFYAGVPLVNEDGFSLGTLCILDQKKRNLSEDQTNALRILAKQVVDKLELRRKTERQAESKKIIEAKEQRLQNMVMASPIAIAILAGKDFIIEMANPPMYTIWNRNEEVLGMKLLDAFPELIDQPFPRMLHDIREQGKPVSINETEVIIVSNGETRHHYIDFTYSPLFDAAGNVEAVMASVMDITERVRSRKQLEESEEEQQALNEELSTTNEELASTNEELTTTIEELASTREHLEEILDKLTESEAKARYLISDAPVAIGVLTGRNLIIETANDLILEIWGKDRSVIGKSLKDALPELDGQPFLQLLDDVITSGKPFYGTEAKVILERKGVMTDGYYNFVYHPIKNEREETMSIMVVANEVTNQYMALKKIEEAETKLRLAIDAAQMGTWYINSETREFLPSQRLKEIFGFLPGEEMPYESATDQIADDHRQTVIDAVEASISRGEAYELEYPIITKHSQDSRWLRATGKLFDMEDGRPSHFSGTILDITELKKDEIRKSDFIAIVSHELKTPLTSLTAYLQMLALKTKTNEDNFIREALDKSMKQVKKMTAMINGFLNVSRLESGKIHLEKQEFTLNSLIQEVLGDISITSPSHEIVVECNDNLRINADREKISNVFTNLITNAMKYSPKGSKIEISCAEIEEALQVSIKDEGVGINEADQESLFDRYYRVENKNTKHISGFGIGLYLTAEILKRHHGVIRVTSNEGQGSTFHFTLPLNKASSVS